jgi:hypothetical protein
MNTTFVLTGVLILVGLFLTRSIWLQRRLTTWALIHLGVAGLGTILSPENVNVLFHLIGALNIPAGNAAMILLGLAIWRERIELAWFSVFSGVIASWTRCRARSGDSDRSRRRPCRTHCALSAGHLADRFRVRDPH